MELEIFKNNGYKIRGFMVNGEPYFVGKDIAESLGYEKPEKAVSTHVRDKHKIAFKDLKLLDTPQFRGDELRYNSILVKEAGLYSLIMKSKLEKAEEFQDWVTEEVLPSIRKNGGYGTPRRLSTDELLELTQTRLIEIKKQKEKAVKMMESAKMIEFNNNKVDDTISMADFAHILSDRFGVIVGRNIIYVILREMGLVMQSSTQPSQRGLLVYLAYRKHENGYSTRVFKDKANQLSKYIIKFLSNNDMFNDAIGNPFQI